MNNFYLIFCKKRTFVSRHHNAVGRKEIRIQNPERIQIFHRTQLKFFQSIIYFSGIFIHMSLKKSIPLCGPSGSGSNKCSGAVHQCT